MRRVIQFIIGIIIIAFMGCSSTGNHPIQTSLNTPLFDGDLAIGVTGWNSDGTPSEGFGALGVYTLNIDADKVSAELTPLRQTALTDTLEVVDITNFLMLAPCTNCAKIFSIEQDDFHHIVLRIGVKHPFDVGDPLKPITGRNRADLHVFNVEGIIAAQDSETISFGPSYPKIASTKLLNASGYTPYLDAVLDPEVFQTEADLHPYRLHWADYSEGNFNPASPTGFESVTTPPPSGNLVMAMGCDYDEDEEENPGIDYIFDIPSGYCSYTFVVGCTYAVSSASKSQRFTPEYRIPQHLKKAASEVKVIPPVDILKEMDPDFEVTMQVQVIDPSHGVEVGDALDKMFADSSVSTVSVVIPDILSIPLVKNGSEGSGVGHDWSSPLEFSFTFDNELGAVEGVYHGFVKVTDTYSPGQNQSPLLSGMDGIKRVDPLLNPLTGLFPISEFATYSVFDIGVELGHVGTDPVAILTRGPSGCYPRDVTLDASDSYDAEDDLSQLRFEFEYFHNPSEGFQPDTPLSSNPITIGEYHTPGCFIAAVRVWDTDDNKDIATIKVPVTEFALGAPEVDITDGASIMDVWFRHGDRFESGDVNWPGLSYQVVKGSVRNDDYIFSIFARPQSAPSSIYFTRSIDDGDNWDVPIVIKSLTGTFGGCSITADKTGQVLIVWTDRTERDLGLTYSANNGDSFEEILVHSNIGNPANPDVAIDPTDPNNVLVYTMIATSYMDVRSRIYRGTSGPSGAFTQVFDINDYRPGWVDNVYHGHIHFAVDGDAYFFAAENAMNFIQRSSDSGETWPDDAEHRYLDTFGGWHRDMDSALDPYNPDVFYITRVERNPWNPTYPIKLFKASDGLQSALIQSRVNDNAGSGVYKLNPSVSVNDASVVYVSWQSIQTGNWEIMIDYSCTGGSSFGTDYVMNTINADAEIDPDLIPNCCGDRVICIWEQNGLIPSGKLVSRRG